MQQLIAVVLILLLVIFTFIPASYLSYNYSNRENIKQILTLSAKVLVNSIKEDEVNFNELSRGTRRQELSTVEIDKDRLLSGFNDMLSNNIPDKDRFEYIKSHIPVKALVYYDKFYIADVQDHWSPPYFFTYSSGSRMIYLNTKNNAVYYYDEANNVVQSTIDSFGISEKQKSEIIINKLNGIIYGFTSEKASRNGLNIQIYNQYNRDPEYIANQSYFNILDGITFFVVYAEDSCIDINMKDFKYTNYNVVGYTLELK